MLLHILPLYYKCLIDRLKRCKAFVKVSAIKVIIIRLEKRNLEFLKF